MNGTVMLVMVISFAVYAVFALLVAGYALRVPQRVNFRKGAAARNGLRP